MRYDATMVVVDRRATAAQKTIVDTLLREGWEPYAVTALGTERIMHAFRRVVAADQEPTYIEPEDLPGQYL